MGPPRDSAWRPGGGAGEPATLKLASIPSSQRSTPRVRGDRRGRRRGGGRAPGRLGHRLRLGGGLPGEDHRSGGGHPGVRHGDRRSRGRLGRAAAGCGARGIHCRSTEAARGHLERLSSRRPDEEAPGLLRPCGTGSWGLRRGCVVRICYSQAIPSPSRSSFGA